MHTVHLNGADAQKIADLMGGVLIMHNVTDDTALISGGDPSKLKTEDRPAKYYVVCEYSIGRGPTRQAHREYSQGFETQEEAIDNLEKFATMYPELKIRANLGETTYTIEGEEGQKGRISIQSLLSRPLEEETDRLATHHFTIEVE